MPKVLVAEHESGARKELDTETGALTAAPATPASASSDPIERLWPKDARGRWQTLGATTFILYRVGTRLYFRAGTHEVELGPRVSLTVVEHGDDNEVIATRDGTTLFAQRYPSQLYRRVDPFIDPWETDDDLDMVLWAVATATDPGRRQGAFATEEEIRDGEITPDDVTRAVRETATMSFPRSRAVALFRELERWWWRWEPQTMEGWGPRCTLCGESPISRTIVGVHPGGAAPSFTMEARHENAALGFCDRCVTAACRFFATGPAARLRADAALADMSRALRQRGALRDEEIAARLASLSAEVPADPVSAARCSICKHDGRDCAGGRGDARLCATCVATMRRTWRESRDQWVLTTGGKSADSRWESTHVLILHGAYRLHLHLSPHPDLPIVISPAEIERWDPPYDDVPLDALARQKVQGEIRYIVRKQFGRDVELRD